ncbi:unnamed protein product [Leptidea sinapis]|uniref:Down syndrome cell adhesion molecule n=1 Tax=Leptidea sinapis TaxID=189913 RepID=A0A5E4QAJ8_9NEOP|nr:unnamed protein product [Leptidea sinapis]
MFMDAAVSPKWVTEPQDEAVLAGEPIALHCQTTAGSSADYEPLVNLGGRFQFMSNGTLWFESTLPYDEGSYTCKAENGVGASLSKTIFLAVNEPARFELTSHNVSARKDAAATLACEARGDAPLRLTWLSISEAKTDGGLRSQLYISRTERLDSGVYKCQAVNAYGHSDHYIYLSVQEILSRAVRLSWSQGFDGNSPLEAYTLQYSALSPQGAIRVTHWELANTINITLQGTPHAHVILTKKGDVHYEALLSNLKPHTAYMIRIAALNQIDRSAFTEPVVVKTQEEAPSEAPSNVQVTAGGPGELHVTWRPPPRDAWHGELLGYSVSCTELPQDTLYAPDLTRTLTVNGWSATELTLSSLKKFTRYEVRVRAFNGVAAGPVSAPVTATTLEGADVAEIKRVTATDTYLHTLHKYTNYSIQVLAFTGAGDGKRSSPVYCMTEEDVPSAPEKIKALAYSSDSVLVSWLPPVHPNGIISHYTVYYREAGRLGKHSSFTVSADKNPEMELMFQVRNLMENQLYEFWVSATTGSGEGESTLVVGQGPSYVLQYKQASENEWHNIELSPESTSYTMDMLKCGTTYLAKVQAQNKISLGPPRPKPPKSEEHVHMNSTAIKINFYAWRDGGCPILGFRVAYRRVGDEHWIKLDESLSAASHVLGPLSPATWYEVVVEAWSDAGVERVTLLADTHTLAGAPPVGSARSGSLRTVLVSCAASAVVVVAALAALLCLLHGKRKFFCLSNDHYLRDNRKLSESNEAEREKLREGQKLYSSSSINGNEKLNDDSSAELYEISPYATFGVGGVGAGAGAAAHSLHFRTLARRDDDAAPPHRRRRACDHYRYVRQFYNHKFYNQTYLIPLFIAYSFTRKDPTNLT